MMIRRRSSRGFTLIEIIVVIVLIGSMMAGMSTLFITNISNSHKPYLRQRALAVAVAFLDEIQHKRWNENTPVGGGCVKTATTCLSGIALAAIGSDGGETRVQYDDIDDYHGIDGISGVFNQTPPQSSDGSDMPGYAGFSVTVTVTEPAGAWHGVPAVDVRLINISVTSSSNETISLSTYRVNN